MIEGLDAVSATATSALVEEFALPAAERRAALIADVAKRHRPGPDSLGAGRPVGTADPR